MFDPKAYGRSIESILTAHDGGNRLMPLAPKGPLAGAGLHALRKSSNQDLFENPIASEDFADCVRSALFLYLSDLDQSHTISQSIPTATGSFLHGIMHRQEPDYSNSKYWFRRVGDHDVFLPLREGALELLARKPRGGSGTAMDLHQQIAGLANWDAFWFVDQCEAAGRGDVDLEQHLLELQRLEWQLLFDYCYHKAVGAG